MRNEPSACIFGNEAEIQAVGHTLGHRQQLTVSMNVQNCWKCLYIYYSWIRSRASIPSPAPKLPSFKFPAPQIVRLLPDGLR